MSITHLMLYAFHIFFTYIKLQAKNINVKRMYIYIRNCMNVYNSEEDY